MKDLCTTQQYTRKNVGVLNVSRYECTQSSCVIYDYVSRHCRTETVLLFCECICTWTAEVILDLKSYLYILNIINTLLL